MAPESGKIIKFAVLVGFLIVALPAAGQDPFREELRKLEGQWVQVSVEADGHSESSTGNVTLTIGGDLWIERSAAGAHASRFAINPIKNPKQIDTSLALGKDKTLTIPGIYELADDTLKVSTPFAFGGNAKLLRKRPTEFATKRGDPFVIIVYKRAKPEVAADLADEAPPLAWQSDWKSAFQMAKQQHRLVFVDYFATWCGPCVTMDATVFREPDVKRRLSDFVLLRVDVDRSNLAATHRVFAFPTYVVYDPAERERFRVIGAKPADLFSAVVEDIRLSAPSFVRAADLFDEKQDVEAALLVGNTYSHLRLTDQARVAYKQARKSAEARGDPGAAQLAEALSAFTYAREGNPSRAVQLIQSLVTKPANRDTEALLWLMLGNAYRAAKDSKSAVDAYHHAQSIATPESTAYKEASAALASAQ